MTTGPRDKATLWPKIVDADLAPSETAFRPDMVAESMQRTAGLQALLIDRAGGLADIHPLAEVLP